MSNARQRLAFTLVELMIAILLLALLTSAATISFSGSLKRAHRQDALDEIRSFDQSTRELARRQARSQQELFDLTAHTIARRDNEKSESSRAQVQMPNGISIDEIRVGGRVTADGDEAVVNISAMGLSETYAAHVIGPDLDTWVIVAGITGSMTEVPDESTMATLLASGAPSH